MKAMPVIQEPRPPERLDAIPIRAHTVLCLQGFRGEGYSPSFVDNMAVIHQRLSEDPSVLVKILDGPDVICAACPHLRPAGCSLRHERSEFEMRAQDHDVLARLGLREGDQVRWVEVLDRIRTSLTPDSLTTICGSCQWLSLGYCREGIDRLRTFAHSETSSSGRTSGASLSDEPKEGR